MSETPWTKGKWIISDSTGNVITTDPGETGDVICKPPVLGSCSHERWDANARLISCAPEMYEALETIVADTLEYERINNLAPNPGHKHCWDAVTRAIALLAKARGETKDP